MATRINNSEEMNSTSIGNKLINVINKISGKNVANAKYDKTILATIQTCIDASIGQYKIKYQNGYFTAYSQDTDIIYAQGASVYVTVPENNMSNRLLISGNASNDNTTKKYITNLEGDQAFTTKGPNLLDITTKNALELRPYNSPQTETVYTSEESLSTATPQIACKLIKGANDIIRSSGGAIRLGATFKTRFDDVHKYGGDYGLKLKLRFKTEEDENGVMQYEEKYYILNTTAMNGTPFEFTNKMPQYEYWEIDTSKFDSIVGLYAFCEGFETSTDPDELQKTEIWISNITLHAGEKVFDFNDNKCATIINCDEGFDFDTEGAASKVFRATLRVCGNDVKDSSQQNLEYYWAIPDTRVNTAGHPNYNEHTGLGWRCLNTKKLTKTNSEDLEHAEYIVTANSAAFNNTKDYEWKTDMPKISLNRNLFLARSTTLKCVIYYSGQNVAGTEQVTKSDGYYVLIHSTNGTVFKGGEGTTTLTAGIYKDTGSETPENHTITLKDSSSTDIRQKENITKFIWTVIKNGSEEEIPCYDDYERLTRRISCPDWSPTKMEGGVTVPQDNENAEMHTIKDYLAANPNFGVCRERYIYYNDKYNYYLANHDTPGVENTYATICNERINYTGEDVDKKAVTIIPNLEYQMRSRYIVNGSDGINDFFILGPSDVEAKYTEGFRQDYTNAYIDPSTIKRYYYGYEGSTTDYSYEQLKDLNNTIFDIQAPQVGASTTFKVTAIIDGTAVGEAEISLGIVPADNTKYTLEIVNGSQTFVYGVDGKAPTKAGGSANPISIQPLGFRLYDKQGNKLLDSDTMTPAEVTKANPTWKFTSNEKSLIQTLYVKDIERDPQDYSICYLTKEKQFCFTLLDEFDPNKRNNNNVTLTITYSDDGSIENEEVISAVTNFMFIKEGSLGTNGTGTYVEIEQPNYDKYVADNNVFPDLELNVSGSVREEDTIKQIYKYDQRHLRGAYLYCNQKYNGDIPSAEGGTCYIQFPSMYVQDSQTKIFSVVGTTDYVPLDAYLNERLVRQPVNSSSKWSLETSADISPDDPNIEIDGTQGASTQIKARGRQLDPLRFLGTSEANTKTPNNTIKLETSYNINSSDVETGNPADLTRTNYGFYTIPYFYYQDTSSTNSSTIDPAHHIAVVGGFDEVIYDEKGLNPTYNSQEPFRLFLFTREGVDVTRQFLENLKYSGTASKLEWYCSKGFSVKKRGTIEQEFVDYTTLTNGSKIKLNSYCQYNGKYYKCIYAHYKPNGDPIYDATGEELEGYQAGDFVDDFWSEIVPTAVTAQQFEIEPYSRYEAAVKENLFNAWVAFKAKFVISASFKAGGVTITPRTIYAEGLIPINMLCNRYGSELLNKWDGKRLELDNGAGTLIASQVAAGKKYDDNSFVGVTIGRSTYHTTEGEKEEIGLFAYGRADENKPTSWGRTAFLDATTGKLVLGHSGGSQIVLDPRPQTEGSKEIWSKLNGWYISSNYFFKPIGEYMDEDELQPGFYDDPSRRMTKAHQIAAGEVSPGDIGGAGMYVPAFKKAEAGDVFIWASTVEKDFNDPRAKENLTRYRRALEREEVIFDNEWQPINYEQIKDQRVSDVAVAQSNLDAAEAGGDAEAIAEAQAVLDEAQEALETLEENYKIYDTFYKTYQDEIDQLHSGQEVKYNGDKTKANFYVTYGGKLHATSADIEGHINARSGRFGVGNNYVEVMRVRDDSHNYILYNRNFWVRDSSGTTQDDCAAYLNGTIIAKSGMFGEHVDYNLGDPTVDKKTVFVYKKWYPREEPLGDHKYPYGLGFDTSVEPNHQYILLHKNFSVDAEGETVMNGHVFATEGRIGDWILHERGFLSSRFGSNVDPDNHIDSFIKLNPEPNANNTYDTDYLPDISIWDQVQTWDWLGPRDGNRIRITPGKIELGLLKLTSLGQIEGGGSAGHPAWYIEPSGVAHFGSTTISTTGSVVVGQGQTLNCGGTTISSTGTISIPSGETMQIGNNASLTAGANGFTFSGAGVNFETSNFYIKGNATIKNGLTLEDGNITVDSGNLVLSNGNANLQSGDLTLSTGNINVTTGNISATQGTTTLGSTTIIGGKTFTCAGSAAFQSGEVNFGAGTTCNFGGATVFSNSPTFNEGISLTAWSGLTAGGQSLEAYIKQVVNAAYIKAQLGNTLSVTVSGNTGYAGEDNHRHSATLSGTITL